MERTITLENDKEIQISEESYRALEEGVRKRYYKFDAILDTFDGMVTACGRRSLGIKAYESLKLHIENINWKLIDDPESDDKLLIGEYK